MKYKIIKSKESIIKKTNNKIIEMSLTSMVQRLEELNVLISEKIILMTQATQDHNVHLCNVLCLELNRLLVMVEEVTLQISSQISLRTPETPIDSNSVHTPTETPIDWSSLRSPETPIDSNSVHTPETPIDWSSLRTFSEIESRADWNSLRTPSETETRADWNSLLPNLDIHLFPIPSISLTPNKPNIKLLHVVDMDEKDPTDCPICLETNENHNIVKTNCGHEFCADCIAKTISSNRGCIQFQFTQTIPCPLCRTNIVCLHCMTSDVINDISVIL